MFIFCKQKINFILHVFLEILQRYCELAIFGTLGMPGYTHQKWYYQKLLRLSTDKKSVSSPMFFWRYGKDMQNSYFGYFGHTWLHMPKMVVQLVENFDVYLHPKNILQYSLLPWDITFYRIWQFDWPTAFWPVTNEPEYEIGDEISTTSLVLILDYFLEKLTPNFF